MRRGRILSEVSRILLDYTGDDEVEPLRRVVDKMVEALGDWCSFSLIQPDGILKTAVAYHPDPRQREVLERLVKILPPQRWDAPPLETNPLVQKRPIYFESLSEEFLRAAIPDKELFDVFMELGLTSIITAPMIVGGEPLGTMGLASVGPGGRRYTEADVDFVFALAGRTAIAVRNARLVRALTRERLEAEQRASQLLAVLRSDPNGIAIFGPDDRLLFASPSLDALLGRPISQQAGATFEELLHSHGPADAVEREERARSNRALFANQAAVTREQMQINGRDLIRISTPVRAGSDSYAGRLFVFVDMTAERELDRQRAEFLTVAAHELRTPLTPLSIFLETLERRIKRNQPLPPDLLGKARRQVVRLEKLVQDLLDVSRIDSGRLQLRIETFALDDMAAEVVADFRDATRQHELHLHRPAERLLLRGDRERLEQVLVNLVQNAIKYSPQGGRIDIAVERLDGEARVSVTDQGIGIPEADRGRLFERFFRGGNVAATHYGGLGIGLFVSHQIVERHGGRFAVESEIGRGTTIRFLLPLEVAPMKERTRPRILLVDDDADILEATAGFLKDDGYDVVQARDGQTALDLVRSSPPDLMLIDLMMPVVDGRAFMERLRDERLAPGVPVVIFSADRDARQKAAQLGADSILHKPFSLEELHELVQRLLNDR